MILIPGLSSSGETWDTTVAHYQDRFQCHVLTVAGFAGVPRVPAPMLDRVRDGLADYIRKNQIEKPVIVDAYPFFGGLSGPEVTPAKAQESVDRMRQYMGAQIQDMYERYVKSGVATRMMVTRDADFERIVGWGLASDRTAVTDAMCELFAADLRDELAIIKTPTLVLGTWIGASQYTDRQRTEANLRRPRRGCMPASSASPFWSRRCRHSW